jgi:hypothetical protein
VLRAGILVVAVAAALVAVPGAQARRAATPAELQAMAAAAGAPAQCAVAVVSTVDPRFGSVRNNDTVGCPESNGFSALRRAGAGWEEVGVISTDITARCPDEVPARAGRDLLLCRRPVAYVACKGTLRERPARCATGSFALRSLRWTSWGAKTVFARGATGARKVRVKAYGRRTCASGDVVYTRLKTRTANGTKVTRLPRLCPS